MRAARDAVAACKATLDHISRHLARQKLTDIQPEAFGLARRLAEVAAADAMIAWAEKEGAFEHGLAEAFAAMTAAELDRWTRFRVEPLGLTEPPLPADVVDFASSQLATHNLARIGAGIVARDRDPAGAYGLSDTHRAVQREFARFSDERIAPVAEHIHENDALLPEPLLRALADLGVFGSSIPEEYGGNFYDHLTMIIATEELSRGSLGAGGSVITRPEICAKALLKGGTDAQKAEWLPRIASGERIVSIAVTEPDAGSDVARVKPTAKKVEGGYVLSGEKTWCTFAGRADLMCMLARTSAEGGHKGLTMFLVEKPGTPAAEGDSEERHRSFDHAQPGGGTISGHAIRTVGYRGMHSFAVAFEDWFVPDENRIGEEGQGFYLQMEGFSGGRIQTAARAVGVMEAAFRAALAYVKDRKVFGQRLADLPLTQVKLAEMALRIQAGRQLAYAVGAKMDAGGGQREASLVKLMSCKDAEWVTREAMQLHGGMGYSEEYAVSRYWQDARVLSIFEGAEEVLALLVIARQHFADLGK